MQEIHNYYQNILQKLNNFDGLGAIAIRMYLVPVFWVAGSNKLSNMEDVIAWFQYSLGFPLPTLMAYLAAYTEVAGAVLLFLGLGVRLISIPLMITMLVAAVSVHWHNGWQAIHDLQSPFASATAEQAIQRLERAKVILKEHSNYDWLTEHGNFVISNNGIEWAITYFVMCFALIFLGGGRYVSLDYWIGKKLR